LLTKKKNRRIETK